jgi:hypothetical protein
MLRVKDIQEQVKLTSNAKRGMKSNGINGIEINYIETLCLTPNEVHSIITCISITVHSKSLLLDRWTLYANIARHLCLKTKLLECVARAVKSNRCHWYRHQIHYIHWFPEMCQIINIFWLIYSKTITIIVIKWRHLAQQNLFKKIVCHIFFY